MDCVVNVRKANGPTSHDVVNQVRRVFGLKRVGHAGTLDPMATGVLVVCLGKATRIVEYLVGAPKEYRARIVLGLTTDSQDSTGAVLEERDASFVTRDMFDSAVAAFVGEIEQVPPMISALKHEGKPLYKLARAGKTVERQPRKVTIYSAVVLGFEPGERAEGEIRIVCSSGTYIRTICADIGERLGCGANMSELDRTKVGRFLIEDSVTIEQLHEAKESGSLGGLVCGMDDAISDMHGITLDSDEVMRVLHGLPVAFSGPEDMFGTVRMLSDDGVLIGLGNVCDSDDGKVVRPHKVLTEIPQ